MSKISRKPIALSLFALTTVLLLAVVVYAGYLAAEAGQLPWQEDPTRIPVTPFGEIPGFSPPTPLPTATWAT